MALDETKAIQLSKILSVEKHIPMYQRNYVWEKDLRENFFENICEAFEADKEYFIGSMVFRERNPETNQYEIVDGQQRVTTAVILLSAALELALKRNKTEGEEFDDLLSKHKQKLTTTITDKSTGKPARAALLRHADATIDKAYETISAAVSIPETATQPLKKSEPVMVTNLRTAQEGLQILLNAYFDDHLKSLIRLNAFIEFLLEKVVCICHVASDIDTALTIYTRLNSSGKSLGKLEILKGKTFQEATEGSAWEDLDERWDSVEELLATKVKLGGLGNARLAISEESLLLYVLFLDFPQIGTSQERIADPWVGSKFLTDIIFSREVTAIIKENPLSLVSHLATFLEEVRSLKTAECAETEQIKNYLIDIAAVAQNQTIWLLVGILLQRHFPKSDEAFRVLRNMVFLFSFVLTGSGTSSGIYKEISTFISPKSLGRAPKQKDLEKLVSAMRAEISHRLDIFAFKLDELRYSVKSQRSSLRRILEFVDIELGYLTRLDTTKHLYSLHRKGALVNLDHLQPQKAKKLSDDRLHHIGNLALLSDKDNKAVQDKPYETAEKQGVLGKSEFILTKALVNDADDAVGQWKSTIPQHFSSFGELDEAAVTQRAGEIVTFLKLRLQS